MRSAIILSLDYQNHSALECQIAWQHIEHAFRVCGFRVEGRLFTSNLPLNAASQKAEIALKRLAHSGRGQLLDIGALIKDFYAFEYQGLTDIPVPRPKNSIEVHAIDADTITVWPSLEMRNATHHSGLR